MKAKITDIRFTERTLVARVAFSYSLGEAGYDDCLVDVLDENGNPTGQKTLIPFTTVPIDIPEGTTKPEVKERIIAKLRKFKHFHQVAQNAQQYVGIEYEE